MNQDIGTRLGDSHHCLPCQHVTFRFRMSLMKQQELLMLLNLDPGVPVFFKWGAHIRRSRTPKYAGCCAENACAITLWAELATIFMKHHFSRKEDMADKYHNSVLNIRQTLSQKWTKWTCHLRKTTDSIYCQEYNSGYQPQIKILEKLCLLLRAW